MTVQHGTPGSEPAVGGCCRCGASRAQRWWRGASPLPRRSRPVWMALAVVALAACGAQPGTVEGAEPRTVEGTLPDGTHYRMRVPDTAAVDEVEGIGAALVVDQNGSVQAVGVSEWQRWSEVPEGRPHDRPSWEGSELTVPAGEWALIVDVYPEIQAQFGWPGDQALLDRITVDSHSGLPTISFPSPLRLDRGDHVPILMEVMYRDVRVVAGCDHALPAVCDEDSSVMVTGYAPDQTVDGFTIVTP